MAFGDAVRGGDGATVRLNADTGQFNAKIEAAERQWRESVGQMSREALKLDLAQDRLRKSLANYGAESVQAKRATIALKDAEEAAARAADKQTRETQQLDRAQSRQHATQRRLTRSVVGLAAGYVGVYGLVAGVRSLISAAKEEELVHGQTKVALDALGISYDAHRAKIERVIRATSQLGFDDEELLKSFQLLVRGSRNVDVALERVGLAAAVARGRYRDLEFGTQVVNKAQLGMIGTIRRLGIDIDKNATATEALAALTSQYGKAAVAAQDTAAAASDRLAVEWENLKEVAGRGLLPAVTQLSDKLADYFSDADNVREVQRRVNEAVETGEKVVRGFAGALQLVRKFGEPVVDLLGGLENAIRLATLGWVAFKVKAVAGLVATAVASAATRTKMLADAAAVGAAWDIATRPRALVVTTSPVPGTPGTTRGLGRVRGAIATGILSFGPQAAYVAAFVILTRDTSGSPKRAGYVPAGERHAGMTIFFRPDTQQFTYGLTDEVVPTRLLIKWGILVKKSSLRGRDASDRAAADTGADGGGAGDGVGGGGGGGARLSDLQLALAREEARGGDVRDELRALRAFYARQIRALEARKNLTAAQKEKLRGLYGEIANVQSQLDAIAEEGERKLEEQRRKAEEKRRRRQERDRQLREKAEEDFRRKDERAFRGRLPPGQARMRPEAERTAAQRARAARDRAAAGEKGLTQADVRREIHELLAGLHGVVSGFGSNIDESGSMGQVATHAYVQTELLREQNRTLARMAGGMWHVGARYASAELSAAGLGVGF